MINFQKKKLENGLKFQNFELPNNINILKIFFEEKDVRKTKEESSMHLDIFGNKLYILLDILLGLVQENLRLEKSIPVKSKIESKDKSVQLPKFKGSIKLSNSLDKKVESKKLVSGSEEVI